MPPKRVSFVISTKILPDSIYKEAWAQLYNAFGERLQQDELELMDAVLQSVKLDFEEQQNAISDKTPDKV